VTTLKSDVTHVTLSNFPSFGEKSDLLPAIGNKGNTPEKHPLVFYFLAIIALKLNICSKLG